MNKHFNSQHSFQTMQDTARNHIFPTPITTPVLRRHVGSPLGAPCGVPFREPAPRAELVPVPELLQEV